MKISILERKPGVFRLRIETRGPGGKRLFAYETVRGDRADADERRAQLLAGQKEAKRAAPPKGVTVREYTHQWLRRRVALKQVGELTADLYRYAFDTASRFFGDVPVAELTKERIEAAYVELLTTPQGAQSKRPLSATTLRYIHDRLKQAMARAVLDGVVASNVFDRVERPKRGALKQETIWEGKLAAFLDAMRDHPKGPLIRFAVATGCRRGEMCGLRWDDIDWQEGAAHIRRTMVQPKGRRPYEKEPKTKASIRKIRLPAELLTELRWHYDHRACDHVFAAQGVRPFTPNAMTGAVNDLLERHGLGQFTLHDLRHAHATYLLRKKENPKAVSRRLGHSDIGITLRVYGHAMEEDDASLAERVNSLFDTPAGTVPGRVQKYPDLGSLKPANSVGSGGSHYPSGKYQTKS